VQPGVSVAVRAGRSVEEAPMTLSLRALLEKLWKDDAGSILATEYLMLGSIVALGGAVGLNSMRDAAVNEMAEFGSSVRAVTQTYRENAVQSMNASRSASPYQKQSSVPSDYANQWSQAVP
jgi:hypothetical protein